VVGVSIEKKILEIIKAEYLSGYRLRLHFNDGKIQVVDFEPFLRHARNPMIRKYLDVKLFQQFSIEYGDLIWNDYELCFPIADLYAGVIEHEDVYQTELQPEYLLKVAEQGSANFMK
jgi:hypothetical protein